MLDGWEATRQLKADAGDPAHPGHRPDRPRHGRRPREGHRAGCDDYDTKPVELARLLEKIEALLGRVAGA